MSALPLIYSPAAFQHAALFVHHHRLPRNIAAEFGVPIDHARWFVAGLVAVGADIDRISTRRLIMALLRQNPGLAAVISRGLP